MLKDVWLAPRRLLVFVIEGYQKYLSLDHGFMGKAFGKKGFCKYYPSCSEYSRQSIIKYGVIFGTMKSIWRILRCNPWSKGGIDEA
ncbi:membrane protein insertion efficiency factor YidD [Candidatus Peregrinibacteria bacterium CG10_big_fil_rev_8_21_14_0_10_36_19]|nr:MAG: membrane protein insertion efficiency factor YidD [Candidatus Peregrinibacteria bacterium CG10_big_fil_rev_8_21_14_0_10_36_19]